MPGSSPHLHVKPAPGVVSRRLSDQAVLVNLSTGACFELDAIGAEIWELIGVGSSRNAILAALLDSYDAEPSVIESELTRLLDELTANALIDTSDEGSGTF